MIGSAQIGLSRPTWICSVLVPLRWKMQILSFAQLWLNKQVNNTTKFSFQGRLAFGLAKRLPIACHTKLLRQQDFSGSGNLPFSWRVWYRQPWQTLRPCKWNSQFGQPHLALSTHLQCIPWGIPPSQLDLKYITSDFSNMIPKQIRSYQRISSYSLNDQKTL